MKSEWRDLLPLLPGRAAVLCLLLSIGVSAALIATGPAYIQPGSVLPTLLRVLGIVGLIFLILWRPGLGHGLAHRLVTVLCGTVFLIVAWEAIRILNHTTMTLAYPLADDMLDAWDKALGLDWQAYFKAVSDRPALRDAMAWSYTSLTYLSVMAYLLMSIVHDHRRSIYFLETFTFTAVFCTVAGAFFPARAAVDRYIGADADLSAFPLEPGLYHLFSLEHLRDGKPVELILGQLPGLVTFPSFHTAAGVLLVAATWRSWLFAPACLYAVLMIASTPVYGGHYFVDLIAGTLVAAAIAVPWAMLPRYRAIFAPSRST